ncbi:cutinase Cut1 [Mycobacterium tuberculosis]|nr:cutinase Cut1 [Mycobacterium tuberculosis]
MCSDGMNFAAHDTYADDASMVDQGAAFAASKLGAGPSAPPPPSPVTVVQAPQPGPGN